MNVKNSYLILPLLLLSMPLWAGLQEWADSMKERTYFVRSLASRCLDNSVSRNQCPIAITNDLPAPEKIAQDIANHIPAEKFLCGASTSEHQCSAQCTPEICSWSRFAQQRNLPQPSDKAGSMDLWHHYKDYFDYAADQMKLNSLRFSVEWPLVQPKGSEEWSQEALDHYADQFIYAIKKGITPVVCFHHYTDPNWFLDRGGFEKDENVTYFVTYCTKVYEHIMAAVQKDNAAVLAFEKLSSRQPLWTTFNAPDGYAFRGYLQKQGPPAQPSRSGLGWVTQVLKNTLESHVQVYHQLKKSHKKLLLDDQAIQEPLVGILKNIHQVDAATNTWARYFVSPATKLITAVADMVQNRAFYDFFTRGVFQVQVPFVVNKRYINKQAPGALDFIGLNYYSNRYMVLTQTVAQPNPELATDNGVYYRYPQGMYRAIVELHEKLVQPYEKGQKKKLPLIVAENGIATTDDAKRKIFYHQYLYAISKAVQDGYAVQGYLPWTLATNYEWPSVENNTVRDYGICRVDEQDQSKLIAKEGARSYLDFVKQMELEAKR